ncbi:MAG TPA: preprotein translocase subunit SecG [Pyrinomonadaceae bacterium]|nr:preprotein translocase subunit SecG [Pyrinomonadaceae bacterium]
MLAYTLYGLFILSCAVLIVVILLQPGKSDAGALFTSSVSSTAFGPRGTQSIMARITIGAAISFLLLALALSQPALTGSHSVLQSESVPAASPQPSPSASTAPANAASPSPAADAQTKPAAQTASPAASPEVKKSPDKRNK